MKCGKKICFHGAFKSKKKAVAKERKVHGFIRKIKVRGKSRFVVMTGRKRRKR